jgi:hypothetical protein
MIARLTKHLDECVGPAIRKQVLKGSGEITSESSLEALADYFAGAMERLDALVDEETRRKVMMRCSCRFPRERIAHLNALYRQLQDIDQLLPYMHGDEHRFYAKPIRKGNIIYVTKMPCYAEELETARTKEERRRAYCHCDCVRETKRPVSDTWCACGAGWYVQLWEGILEKSVRVEIFQTVARGDDCCQFAIHLPPEEIQLTY